MGRYYLPAPIIATLALGDRDAEALSAGTTAVLNALAIKQKSPEARTLEEQALLDDAVPYNQDAWDGYGYERDQLLEQARQSNARLIALAGDTHNAWATTLTTSDGELVGIEFGAPSVSSPGLEDVFGVDTATLFESVMVTLIDDLTYTNMRNRGYLRVDFSRDEASATWHFVSDIKTSDYRVLDELAKTMVVDRETLALS